MSPSATPATQTAAATMAPNGKQARHQSQPSAISAIPATQNEGRCHQVPRLPHRMTTDVAKCRACHANRGGDHVAKREPRVSPKPAQCHKRHACHAKRRSISPSTTAATQNEGRCHQVPRLPHRMTTDVAKCRACHANRGGDHVAKREPRVSPKPAQCHKRHACHAKRRSISPSTTPATQNEGRCHQVPRLPHRMTTDVAKCRACHANRGGDHVAKREPRVSPKPAQCHKRHACHAKRRSISPSTTPATQNEGRCHQVPRLPHRMTTDQVPRLPCKQRRRPRRQTGTKGVTKASPVP